MQPDVIRLRRLMIANAEHFLDMGRLIRAWLVRVLFTLANQFRYVSKQPLPDVENPVIAANHFIVLLLWIPVNRAMLRRQTSDTFGC